MIDLLGGYYWQPYEYPNQEGQNVAGNPWTFNQTTGISTGPISNVSSGDIGSHNRLQSTGSVTYVPVGQSLVPDRLPGVLPAVRHQGESEPPVRQPPVAGADDQRRHHAVPDPDLQLPATGGGEGERLRPVFQGHVARQQPADDQPRGAVRPLPRLQRRREPGSWPVLRWRIVSSAHRVHVEPGRAAHRHGLRRVGRRQDRHPRDLRSVQPRPAGHVRSELQSGGALHEHLHLERSELGVRQDAVLVLHRVRRVPRRPEGRGLAELPQHVGRHHRRDQPRI